MKNNFDSLQTLEIEIERLISTKNHKELDKIQTNLFKHVTSTPMLTELYEAFS